jgi:hypothetical protein
MSVTHVTPSQHERSLPYHSPISNRDRRPIHIAESCDRHGHSKFPRNSQPRSQSQLLRTVRRITEDREFRARNFTSLPYVYGVRSTSTECLKRIRIYKLRIYKYTSFIQTSYKEWYSSHLDSQTQQFSKLSPNASQFCGSGALPRLATSVA